MSESNQHDVDVAIVGAGLSGLFAARQLLRAGLTPLVIEASDRVGGRILTEHVDGVSVELGAQWIGDTHERMFALAADLGVGTFRQFDDGEATYEIAGSGVLRETEFHQRYATELAGVDAALRRLDEMSAQVPLEAPWEAHMAAEWDAVTAAQWLTDQHRAPVAERVLEIVLASLDEPRKPKPGLTRIRRNLYRRGILSRS